jgi:alpha-tubulin suppressor-like RCC1 family protein
MRGVKAIAMGDVFSAFLKTDGSVWVTGYTYGTNFLDDAPKALEPSQILTDVSAIAAGGTFVLMLKKDGTLWISDRDVIKPLVSSSIYTDMALRQVAVGVVQIAAGGMMSRYLKADGTLWEFVTAGSIDENDVVSFVHGVPVQVGWGESPSW